MKLDQLDEVEAVRNKHIHPENVAQLKAYSGFPPYFYHFMPNLISLSAPLHLVLRKEVKWKWEAAQHRGSSRNPTTVFTGPGALCQKEGAAVGLRCICLWSGGSVVAPHANPHPR